MCLGLSFVLQGFSFTSGQRTDLFKQLYIKTVIRKPNEVGLFWAAGRVYAFSCYTLGSKP